MNEKLCSYPKTFVSLGNATQSFSRLLSYLDEIYDVLPKPILVQNGYTYFDKPEYCIQKFLSLDEYSAAINSAEILIFHGGAGSVINALKINKKPIVIPRMVQYREHINDHQVSFSVGMSQADAVYMAQNQLELKQALAMAKGDKRTSRQINHENIQKLVAKIFDKYSEKVSNKT